MEFLGDWLRSIGVVLAQSGPYLLAGFVIAGLLKMLLPEKLVYRHLGGNDLRSVGIASIFGVPIPLCSCSVLPSAVALRRAGASKGATTSFLISTPETGVDSIGVTWALMDPLMTIARPLAALFSAILSGSLVNVLVRRKLDDEPVLPSERAKADSADSCEHDHDHDHDHSHELPAARGPLAKLRGAVSYGFGPLMADLTPSFIVGFILSGLILVIVPADFLGEIVPQGWPTMLLMLVVGIPIYICATASTPVAAALVAKGLDPGAALVLLLAGPATNIATMVVVKNFLGKRVLAVYIVSIAGSALLLGWLVQVAYTATGIDARAVAAAVEHEELGPIAILSAVALIGLMVWHAAALKLPARAAVRLRAWCAPFGFDPTSRLSRALGALVLLAVWASTGLSVVNVGEVGFRMRFGELVGVTDGPGRLLHAPFPFERVESVPAELVRGLEIGFDSRLGDGPGAADAFSRDLAGEAEVIAGDENLLRINWSVQWRVKDAKRFAFGLGDPSELLRAFAESSVRRVFSRKKSDELLLADREELRAAVHAVLQRELDEIDSGLELVLVNLIELHAPSQVHEAYRDVASALEDKERQVRQAERYEKELTAQARARAFAEEEGAKSDRVTVVERAKGEAQAFLQLVEAQRAAPDLFRFRLQREAAQRALAAARLVLILAPRVRAVPVDGPTGAPPAAGGAPAAGLVPWEDDDR